MPRHAELIVLMVREIANLPDNWHAHTWMMNHADEFNEASMSISGAVAPIGKRTKRPNFNKLDKSTARTFTVPKSKYEAWVAEWEKRTGKCCGCMGEGKELASYSRRDGATYRPCGQCKGSGKPDPA